MSNLIAAWKLANTPNYIINRDLSYPYSECPFLGEYNLIKIPDTGLVDHVDYWGEGRIAVTEGVSGFVDCYNVNHTYQVVSNGNANVKGRKIPNRIPVLSYTDCRTNSYIKDNSVRLVTLMGAPINKSCSSDIARIINDKEGSVVIFNFTSDQQDVINLNNDLNVRGLVYCPNYTLPEKLRELTLFDSHRAYLNLNVIKEIFYNSVNSGELENAVKLSVELNKAQQGHVIADIVDRLLNGTHKNTMLFASELWFGGQQDIVTNYFPDEFGKILGQEKVKIISKKFDQALKLDAKTDYYNDRQAWGDSSDKSSNRVSWEFLAIKEQAKIVFKIKNMEHSMFLKLDVNVDSYGDRQCWGSNNSDEFRHKWELKPVRFNSEVLFFIVNCEYDQGLKLDSKVDYYGDRLLWGNRDNVINEPNYYGFLIKPW